MTNELDPTPTQSVIGSRILLLRGQRVMLDSDLAERYEMPSKVLLQTVKRKLSRFPVTDCDHKARPRLTQAFGAIHQLMMPPETSRRPIGFVSAGATPKKD